MNVGSDIPGSRYAVEPGRNASAAGDSQPADRPLWTGRVTGLIFPPDDHSFRIYVVSGVRVAGDLATIRSRLNVDPDAAPVHFASGNFRED